jgi:hypothetical protein
MMQSSRRVPMVAGATALLLALVSCSAEEDDEEFSAPPSSTVEYATDGSWTTTGLGKLEIRFEGSEAILVSFGSSPVTGRQHFDVGQPFMRNVTRIRENRFAAEVVHFDTATTDAWGTHIVGASYVDSLFVVGATSITMHDEESAFRMLRKEPAPSADLVHGGACEYRYANISGDVLTKCNDSWVEEQCAASPKGSIPNGPKTETRFWTNTTCRQLGYGHQTTPGEFQYSEGNNALPGAHGEWGDQTGGSGAGWGDGSGGSAASASNGGSSP